MQLTTVGKPLLKAANQASQLEQAGAGDPVVAERLRKLKLVETLRKKKVPWDEVQKLVGISKATYHRWKKRLEEQDLAGLKPKSRKPRKLRRKVHWKPDVLIRIERLRKQNPTWGRWRIGQRLHREGYTLSERTVGRILSYLERSGRVEPVSAFLARNRKARLRRKSQRPYARRKPAEYTALRPGDLVQVDTLWVDLGDGTGLRQFTAVDTVSRWGTAGVYSRASAKTALDFLQQLVRRCPCVIRAIQVDGGSEFMAEFEEGCRVLGIELFVLPPRSPKLNGMVERLQRTFRDEFYTRALPLGIEAIQGELEGYLEHYNLHRPHMALGGLAPVEYLAKLQEVSVPLESQMC